MNTNGEKVLSFDVASNGYRYIDLNDDDYVDYFRLAIEDVNVFSEVLFNVRRSLSKLINSDVDEIALVPDSVTGINMVASSLPISLKDTVILAEGQDINNIYPWMNAMNRGMKIKRLSVKESYKEIVVEELIKELDESILLFSVEHIHHISGFKQDVKTIKKYLSQVNSSIYVEASYSCGAIGVDVKNSDIDFLSCDGHRWLRALHGAGFLYISKRWQGSLDPVFVSRYNDEDQYNIKFRVHKPLKDARKFEFTMPNIIPYLTLYYSLEKLFNYGLKKAEDRILNLSGVLIEELARLGYKIITPIYREKRGGLVTISVGGEGSRFFNYLKRRGVRLDFIEGYIRISIDYTHSEEDIYKLIDIMKEGGRELGLFSS